MARDGTYLQHRGARRGCPWVHDGGLLACLRALAAPPTLLPGRRPCLPLAGSWRCLLAAHQVRADIQQRVAELEKVDKMLKALDAAPASQ